MQAKKDFDASIDEVEFLNRTAQEVGPEGDTKIYYKVIILLLPYQFPITEQLLLKTVIKKSDFQISSRKWRILKLKKEFLEWYLL